ncbi:MAG: N-acetyltransferase [Flavobacteriaceae bacterium]|nr:N-acetyltransferase [Flavobacteriaceae bacterium]
MSKSIISVKAQIGKNVKIGNFCIIEDDVIIGDNTEIKNYVELRSSTKIGSNCLIDSKVSSSGNCIIGNNVTIRYHSIIARGSVIKDNVYISPKVMFNNLDEDKNQIGGAKIEENTFIGTGSVLHHGITIGKNSVIGALSFVNKNIPENEIWFGNPAVFKKKNI